MHTGETKHREGTWKPRQESKKTVSDFQAFQTPSGNDCQSRRLMTCDRGGCYHSNTKTS